MADINYNEYKDFSFGSVIPEEKFVAYADFAMEYINYITMNRLKTMNEAPVEARKAVYAVINEKARIEKDKQDGIITSEKVGDYSVSFSRPTDSRSTEEKRLYKVARMYLAHTGLLYRGVDYDIW